MRWQHLVRLGCKVKHEPIGGEWRFIVGVSREGFGRRADIYPHSSVSVINLSSESDILVLKAPRYFRILPFKGRSDSANHASSCEPGARTLSNPNVSSRWFLQSSEKS